MKKQRKRWEIMQSVVAILVILTLFYRSVPWVLCIAVLLGGLQLGRLQRKWKEDWRWQLNLEFKEGLQGMAAALHAGYSIENALEESQKDLEVLYGEESPLGWEFQVMRQQLQLNQPVEQVFEEFAKRTGVEDIENFASVFRTARRSGGDLVAITRSCAERIGEKIEVNREIHTMIAGKRMEARIMNLVPLGMILYFWVCSPGFLDCFYQGAGGRLMMTVLLIAYLTAYLLSERICRISL